MVNKEEIKGYLKKQCQGEEAKFYVQKTDSKKSVLKAIKINSDNIDDDLVNYFVNTEKQGGLIFVTKPNTDIKKVSFLNK